MRSNLRRKTDQHQVTMQEKPKTPVQPTKAGVQKPVTPAPSTKAPQTKAPAINWSEFEATGFEAATQEDFGIPFLLIIQKGSPEFDRSHPQFATKRIEGCEPGCIINTVTRRVLYSPDGDPLMFIPCAYQKSYVEWRSRESSGGFVRAHVDPNILIGCSRNEKGQDVLPNGNIIVTTAYMFGMALVQDEDGAYNQEKCVIALSSTQLKKARQWLNKASSIKVDTEKGRITPPLYSHKYALTTAPESNDLGSWFGWQIETAGMISNRNLLVTLQAEAKQALAQRQNLLALPAPTPQEDSI